MSKGNGKFPEGTADAISVDNSKVTGPLFFYTDAAPAEPDDILAYRDNEPGEALDPVFKSALKR